MMEQILTDFPPDLGLVPVWELAILTLPVVYFGSVASQRSVLRRSSEWSYLVRV